MKQSRTKSINKSSRLKTKKTRFIIGRWNFRKTSAAIAITGFAIFGTYILLNSQAETAFVSVGVHPQATLQASPYGKSLSSLTAWNGKLYAGYGDYINNTGPVSLTPFDGTSFAAAPEITSQTQAIHGFRTINGKLYAPSIDGYGGSDYAVGTTAATATADTTTPTWQNPRPIGSTHNFDMFTLTGTDLWMVGSADINAVAWRSLDGGATWTVALSVPPKTYSFTRFNGGGVFNGKLYLQNDDPAAPSKVFDGTSWTDGPNLGSFTNANSFAGKLVFHGTATSGYNDGPLKSFDGRSIVTVNSARIKNYTIDGNVLYAVDSTGVLSKTTDLVNWTYLATLTTDVPASVAMYNGSLYLGASNAKLYRYQGSLTGSGSTSVDTTPPSVSISSPINNSAITSTVKVTGTASDAVGVSRTELLIDGQVVASGSNSISYMWKTRKVTAGTHKLEIKAYDAAGNIGTAVISVTK